MWKVKNQAFRLYPKPLYQCVLFALNRIQNCSFELSKFKSVKKIIFSLIVPDQRISNNSLNDSFESFR